ncbi:hypothetical protein V8V91_07315 [Algoriphagus halophilus]|uniref:hypothetical protein n=1 Tax=Algoriphagus halophilus TaxID=226505 RepID=UPI00358E1A7C
MLILEGERTYPSISESIDRFLEKAEEEEVEVSYEFYPHKKHIPMITQFFGQEVRDMMMCWALFEKKQVSQEKRRA